MFLSNSTHKLKTCVLNLTGHIKRRLEDDFDIIMQMDYNHHLYKPISLKIFYREF
jgi:hypothetical protein